MTRSIYNVIASIYFGIAMLITAIGYHQHTGDGIVNASIVGIFWPYFLARG